MKTGFLASLVAGVIVSSLTIGTVDAGKAQGAEEKKKVSGKKPMVKVKRTTLYKNSHIIISRHTHTIIPKRSIIVLPDRLKSHVTDKPSGTFVLWPEFKQSNQDLIWTYEVSLEQAKGIEPLSEGKLKDLAKLNRVVVALYRGNPVSVLPMSKEIAKK